MCIVGHGTRVCDCMCEVCYCTYWLVIHLTLYFWVFASTLVGFLLVVSAAAKIFLSLAVCGFTYYLQAFTLMLAGKNFASNVFFFQKCQLMRKR